MEYAKGIPIARFESGERFVAIHVTASVEIG